MRERQHSQRDTGPAGGDGFADRRSDRETAQRLLAEGGDVIDRALSQDSLAFLDANQQEGGQ